MIWAKNGGAGVAGPWVVLALVAGGVDPGSGVAQSLASQKLCGFFCAVGRQRTIGVISRLRRLVLSDRFSFITCRGLRARARLAGGRTAEFEKAELCATCLRRSRGSNAYPEGPEG
jgi:hypothetical protein